MIFRVATRSTSNHTSNLDKVNTYFYRKRQRELERETLSIKAY